MREAKQADSIFLLTGSVQGGKTTFLKRLTERLTESNLNVGGFLCPGTFESGIRSEFSLKNIQTGVELPMAAAYETSTWHKYRRFWFNPNAFIKGREWTLEQLSQKPDLLVIDEVGPMELEGSGWSELLDNLVKVPVPLQLWSVRENILQRVSQRWNIPSENLMHIDKTEVEQVAEFIITKSTE